MNDDVPPRRSDLQLPQPFDDLSNDGPLAVPPPPEDWHLGLDEEGSFSPLLLWRRRNERGEGVGGSDEPEGGESNAESQEHPPFET